MSGICGTWTHRAGPTGLSCRVQAGLDAMIHRGKDGLSIYPDGQVVLGHCLFDTGCNGMFVDEDGFAISFDGRVDNREELTAALGVERTSDMALLLAAYRHFGVSLPVRLRGDFALAIWDPEASELFLCRDHFGVRPLFYYRDPDTFYFASEIKGLRAMAGDLPFTVRETAIEGFVADEFEVGEPDRTCYEEVLRLLPGHWARITDRGLETQQYWSLNPGLPVRDPHGPVRLRELLVQALNRRMRSADPVGALLSGGIDSSAIVSLIAAGATSRRQEGIRVCSLVFKGEQAEDESPFIDAVLDAYGLEATKIDGSSLTAFQGCDEIVAEQDQPVPAPNIATFRQFIRRLPAEAGVRILLDGHGGDEALSYGNGLFQELAESGRWLRLWRVLGESEELREDRRELFGTLIRRKGLHRWRRWLGQVVRRGKRRTDDPVRYAPDGRPRPAEQAKHLSKLRAPLFARALEGIDHNAAAAGVEFRMPFLDVDLISFCVTVPAQEKWVRGVSRANLRRALAGILPSAIAARRDKFDFTDRVRRSIVNDHAALVEESLYDRAGRLGSYVDLGSLRRNWQALRDSGSLDGEGFQQLWRAVMLSRWLRAQDDRAAGYRTDPLMVAAE